MTTGKLLLCATGVAALAAVGAAVMLEPPHVQREYRLDDRRERDLAALNGAINEYWKRRHALPPNLETLAAELALGSTHQDPATGVAYLYEITGNNSFRLCANFARDSRETDRYTYAARQFEWAHGSGRQCFVLTAKDKAPT